ncbi:M23 family metallopeptidase [Robertkochia sediminum]|uniref:M23 family metallopeptidase n=1 Tax=Robertkochia sediminum TaxID=2785326 RepID=UPI0019338A2A|nr:peptidoglycan DD-metalloendopeptidase family protein [Robertkochia sediminum]MBL7471930.1 peptidoglycan DD-metalloendopeptidase family protein [Robertkochia sediminum]
MLKNVMIGILLVFAAIGCKSETKSDEGLGENALTAEAVEIPEPEIAYGYDLSEYEVIRDTIETGDSFGAILQNNKLEYPQIYQIVEAAKDSFNVASLQAGKPYTLLCSKEDSLQRPVCFIYEPNKVEYVVIDFSDSTKVRKERKPVKLVEREVSGVINSSLYEAFVENNTNILVAYKLSDIYAWTIDFFRIQEGDRFKVIFTEKFVEDTIPVGVGEIKAAYFEHKGEPIYAFPFEVDSTKHIVDYFDENAKNLRRAFLRAPVQFSRISSRYNLKRRIAYYGYKVRPHKGTDFAAPIGTPILATANGTVIESRRKGGNGNYVKIKHNGTYSTQYLHMQKRLVKVGDFVKQGDVIGTIGMTGNTGGPHVCYRFWKNGRQVDPFRQDLPDAEPISEDLKEEYLKHIAPIRERIDLLEFPEEKQEIQGNEELITLNE